ncbi:MAG TPA: cysteine desulfurase family protein [Armatimonadota bacterium]|nr:cysteine desulfurase family protein [Armatimonadota bacterium]
MTSRVYLDHAATTPLDPRVEQAMRPYLRERFGNAGSIHSFGREARAAVDFARDKVAEVLGCAGAEVVFTGGGTEADNLALLGVAHANRARGSHVIISAFEHHAVMEAALLLEGLGFEVSRLPVTADGMVEPQALAAAMRDDTILVSVMLVNNEVGTIQPVPELAGIARERGAYFHTDAVQAAGAAAVNVRALGVDLLSLSGHKFYGPKGVGALYVRAGTRIAPIMRGGDQERELRPGTENVPGIVGFAAALELAEHLRESETARLTALRDRLVSGVLGAIPGARLNGGRTLRVAANANFAFEGVSGETLVVKLDLLGIAASSGSACAAASIESSHVLRAMGLSKPLAQSALRLTLGRDTTEGDVDRLLELLPEVIADLR